MAQRSFQKKGKKEYMNLRLWTTTKKSWFADTKGQLHLWVYTSSASTHNPWVSSSQTKHHGMEWGWRYEVPPLAGDLFAIDNFWKKENFFFKDEASGGSSTLQWMPLCPRVCKQHKLDSVDLINWWHEAMGGYGWGCCWEELWEKSGNYVNTVFKYEILRNSNNKC